MHTPSNFAGQQPEATADELEAQVARMAKIGWCYSPSFSPDGKRVAFISDLNGTPQVWIVPTEGGWPELITAWTIRYSRSLGHLTARGWHSPSRQVEE